MMVPAVSTLAGSWAACGGVDGQKQSAETEVLRTASEELHPRPEINSVALNTGVTLSYLEQGCSNGAVLILRHGWVDSHRSFDRVLPLLPRQCHVYALDQRGHGDSDKPACCYTQGDFVADVVAFMNALGIRKATLAGHSMGTFIAHQFAVMYPHRLDRLVLIGSAPTAAGNSTILDLKTNTVDRLVDPISPDFVREFTESGLSGRCRRSTSILGRRRP
jgi:non-heme chloroperoxidase